MLTLKEERELMAVATEALEVADAAMRTLVADRKKSHPSNYFDMCSDLSQIWGRITQALNGTKNNHSVKLLTHSQKYVLKRLGRKKNGEERLVGAYWAMYHVLIQHGFVMSRPVERGRGARKRYLLRYTITSRGKKHLEELK